MITVATLLWTPNGRSLPFSRMYDESWVVRLLNGFARNLSHEFRFILFTDRDRELPACIEQRRISADRPDYSTCIEPFGLGVPMILCGLDTVVTGDCDALAASCLTRKTIGLPRDPYAPHRACNGVCLVPAGFESVANLHRGENDMEWVRKFPHSFIDDEFGDAVKSYKGHVQAHGIGDTRIVYFHGRSKPHELPPGHPILAHWI